MGCLNSTSGDKQVSHISTSGLDPSMGWSRSYIWRSKHAQILIFGNESSILVGNSDLSGRTVWVD